MPMFSSLARADIKRHTEEIGRLVVHRLEQGVLKHGVIGLFLMLEHDNVMKGKE